MHFNFAFNLNMTMSSADNHFKQLRPRSGLTFCPDLIGVQTVKHFRGYEKLKLNLCIFYFVLNFNLTLSSAYNPFKQFGARLMYFNNALNFSMTFSSADNHFKEFGPRLVPAFCPDLIVVKTI